MDAVIPEEDGKAVLPTYQLAFTRSAISAGLSERRLAPVYD